MDQVRSCLAMLDVTGRRRLALLGLLIVIYTVLEVVSVGSILPFIALVNNPTLIHTNPVAHAINDALGLKSPTTFLILAGSALFALISLKNVYFLWVTRLQSRFSYFQEARVAGSLLERYLAAPFATHLQRNSATMITTIDYSVELVFSQVLLFFIVFITEASSILGLVLFMLYLEPALTLVLGAVLGGSSLLLAIFLRQRMVEIGENKIRLRTRRLQWLQQTLNSVKEIKVLCCEPFFVKGFQSTLQEFAANQVRVNTLSQLPRPVLEVVVSGGIVLIVMLVVFQGRATADIIAVLALFAISAFRILPSINRLVFAYNSIKGGKAAVHQVASDLSVLPLPATMPRPAAAAIRLREAIELRDVVFRYHGRPDPVLDHVSLRIERGEAVGIVGASGAGKSTLVDVILGLLMPQEGAVLIDGQDCVLIPHAWQGRVGYVPQTISLIDETLRNNVAFGIDSGRIDDACVWRALQLAHLDGFVRSLPGGLDTMLGEHGVRLSGGQRQRVGIARALLRDPEILVLDEATAALDGESEREISSAVDALHGEKTLLIIAHRLSTVKSCDKLVLMRNGSVADSGTFDVLLARCDDFREMVRLAELSRSADETTGTALH